MINERLISLKEKTRILEELHTMLVTGKGIPTSANDEIFVDFMKLKADTSERLAAESLRILQKIEKI
jgi:hypothetical protein